MNEFLATLTQAVLLAVVPVCTAFLAQGIRALARYASTKTDSALAQKYLEDAANAITTAVSRTNQTYVDTLKKSDKFTKDYLVSQIEAEVRKQKLAEPLTLGAPVEAVMEVRESPDPVAVAVAAASAAATAATAQVAAARNSATDPAPATADAPQTTEPDAPEE